MSVCMAGLINVLHFEIVKFYDGDIADKLEWFDNNSRTHLNSCVCLCWNLPNYNVYKGNPFWSLFNLFSLFQRSLIFALFMELLSFAWTLFLSRHFFCFFHIHSVLRFFFRLRIHSPYTRAFFLPIVIEHCAMITFSLWAKLLNENCWLLQEHQLLCRTLDIILQWLVW